MMQMALTDLLDEQACYNHLLQALHPQGLHCPAGHCLPPAQAPHDRHRVPIMTYRCRKCVKVFNVFTGTIWSKTHYQCSIIVQLLKGIAQGTPTKHLAAELDLDRCTFNSRRHSIQALLAANFPFPPPKLADEVVEADEMYQNAGEKGIPHPDPADPPRRHANKKRGHGNFETDRPQ